MVEEMITIGTEARPHDGEVWKTTHQEKNNGIGIVQHGGKQKESLNT
jgi:hypothetical protein